MVTFNFNNGQYLDVLFTDKVEKDEIIQLISAVLSSNEYPTNLNVLVDSSRAIFDTNLDHLDSVFHENTKLFDKYNSLRVAIVMSKPLFTALAIIYSRMFEDEKYNYQVFCTVDAAITWLNKGMDSDRLRIYPNDNRPSRVN